MQTRILLVVFFLFTWTELFAATTPPVRIVFFSGNPEIQNDGKKGGLPALATLLKTARAQDGPVLFLHGGRAIAPSTLSSFDRGTHMIDLLNHLKPIVLSVGKSEFAFKEDELTLRSKEASFPFLSTNIFDPFTSGPPEGIRSSLIYKAGKYTIGLFAITSPELMQDYILDRVTILDTEEVISRTSKILRAQGADLIVLTTDYLIPDITEMAEANHIDIVLISEREKNVIQHDNTIQIVHDRSDDVVLLEATPAQIDKNFTWTFSHSFVELQSVAADPEIQKLVDGYISQLTRFLEIEIGVTRTEIDTRKTIIRNEENGFGNLIADAIRSFFKTEIGLMNGGGIRGDRIYPPGTVLTRGDMLREIPFRNHAVQIQVTGEKLLDALENGFSRIEELKGCFPHISGLTVKYNPKAEPFNRVRSVMVGDKPLNPKETYSLATVNFLADGGDGYASLKDCPRIDKFGNSRLLWEYVRDYIAARKEISPKKEGRLLIVSE